MRNVIIICNTYYQLIMAVQLRCTIKKDDDVTLILSDQSNNASCVSESLKKTGLFGAVYFVENREFIKKHASRVKAAKDVFQAVTGNIKMYSFLSEDKKYDELIFYNPDTATHCLFAILYKRNTDMIVSRYEESIISYGLKCILDPKMRMIYMIRRIEGKKNLLENVTSFYCVHPELYRGDKVPIKIPDIKEDDIKLRNILGGVFGVDRGDLRYDAKYIYFSSIFDIEGDEPAGELALIQRIAELVGKDDLFVKVHPRDDVKRFTDAGLKVDARSSVPWEIIQLSQDFSEYIFLTACSSSVITVSAVTEKAPQIYFLYKLCEGDNDQLINASHSIEDIFKMGGDKYLPSAHIVDTIDDLRQMLKV